ncbi:hypothetical protein B9Z55_028680 [Caenorhabditis nigoni]|uniref:Uncharacterized protein n=1 Tax=Caenorhabditis nigoni TaxID=1611254 RepID=A0A2G5SAY0_9PELO|nr:hypothetical protein B9Z55_028680 [Caenorhabditis nigoni]
MEHPAPSQKPDPPTQNEPEEDVVEYEPVIMTFYAPDTSDEPPEGPPIPVRPAPIPVRPAPVPLARVAPPAPQHPVHLVSSDSSSSDSSSSDSSSSSSSSDLSPPARRRRIIPPRNAAHQVYDGSSESSSDSSSESDYSSDSDVVVVDVIINGPPGINFYSAETLEKLHKEEFLKQKLSTKKHTETRTSQPMRTQRECIAAMFSERSASSSTVLLNIVIPEP